MSLFDQRVTILVRTAGVPDPYGNPTVTWADGQQVMASVQPGGSVELSGGRQMTVTSDVVFLAPVAVDGTPVELGAALRIRDADDQVWEIDGQPASWRAHGTTDHIECRVKRVGV